MVESKWKIGEGVGELDLLELLTSKHKKLEKGKDYGMVISNIAKIEGRG